MTSADEAFDKLLEKNALGIPVANPAPEARTDAPAAASVSASISGPADAAPHANASASGDMSEAMRVLELLDDKVIYGGDYNPRNDTADENDRDFGAPTETELEPVSFDAGAGTNANTDTAARQAATTTPRKIITPDLLDGDGGSGGYGGGNDDGDGLAEADAEVVDDDAPLGGGDTQIDPGGDAGLQRARRFRRFAYLPLGGMEHFENRARDMMASLASQEPDKPSLAITGPSRGDGQTEIAIRLALAMAKRVDYRILLADFDVRKPQIAPRLGLSSKHFTLADVLRGSCPLGEALMVSEEDNLYVLPARASDRDGDEVLSDKQVQTLLTKIHANFDFTVISCGAADHADASIVCRRAGATALAGFCRRTRAKALRETADRLADDGANIVGMLLTGA